jgi:rhomboid family GlyGly-CTERM serine protease
MRFPWRTAGLAGVCLAAAVVPGSAEALQYDRVRVMEGEVWRLLTGQLVHWTARMALADLGVLLGLGAWLEAVWIKTPGEGRRAVLTLALGAILTALAVHLLSPDLFVYRGSSGLASTLFVLTAMSVARSTDGGSRGLAGLAVALFLAKAAWETVTGDALFAGPLAPGVRVVPLVHLLGGLAGAALPARRGGILSSP